MKQADHKGCLHKNGTAWEPPIGTQTQSTYPPSLLCPCMSVGVMEREEEGWIERANAVRACFWMCVLGAEDKDQ